MIHLFELVSTICLSLYLQDMDTQEELLDRTQILCPSSDPFILSTCLIISKAVLGHNLKNDVTDTLANTTTSE